MKTNHNSKSEELQRLNAALDLYDNAPCGSVSFRDDGLILDVNTTLAVWLGYSKKELVNNRTLQSLFKIGGQIFFETQFFPLIKLQGFIKEVYFDIVRKDKSILHGLINVREIPKKADRAVSYQATILDISDRWHFESELRKAKQKAEADSKAKADFLSTISHEIRTPLNSILGIGNLLHKTPLNKNQQKYARLLLHSSEHLLSLVNNLLDLSKIEANKIELEHVDFDIHDITSLLKQTFSVRAKEKGIDLRVDLGDDVPRFLVGDPVKLNQILTNLIGNAIKFTKEGSVTMSITVSEKNEKDVCLDFVVTDTGIGIPEEKLETVFQEFSQASYDVSVEFGGTGLGLTISKKLLELHDSTLNVTSELNKGSTFSFNICYANSEKTVSDVDSSLINDELYDFGEFRVLLVDDNPANLFIVEQYLDQWKIDYASAESGMEALEILQKENFNLILLDLQMPIMNGYETALKINDLKLAYSPAIVAFSASTLGEVSKQLKEVGIEKHLSKPFQPRQLYEILLQNEKKPIINKTSPTKLKEKTFKKSEKTIDSAVKNKINAPGFNLDRFKKMANNKPEYLTKFRLSTLDALITYKKDFESAITKKSPLLLSELIHRSTMSLYYIEANRLTELLNECREILKKEGKNEALLNLKIDECLDEFQSIIKGLSKD